AQVLHGHSRALDVPARKAPAPWRVPLHGVRWVGELPQGEICRVMLLRIRLYPCPCLLLLKRHARQLAIIGERSHIVVDPVADDIGMALIEQALYQGYHFGYVLGGVWH